MNSTIKYLLLIISLSLAYVTVCKGQNNVEVDRSIIYTINKNVSNSKEDYFVEIQEKWESYLNANNYLRANNEYWNHDEYAYPEMGYASFLMYLRRLNNNGDEIQCSTVGIVPVKNDYYLLKTIFTKRDTTTNTIQIKYMLSVYAKREDDEFKFYSSTQYFKEAYPVITVGNITYIVHPKHTLNEKDAIKMNEFNTELAKLFEIPPLSFDYVVANDTRDLSEILGLDFFQLSYQPVASGGLADNYNNTIYAGNNSAYYPHELVHMYTHAKYPRQYHSWVDEGIAALMGGSAGYEIEWHWEKVRRFLVKTPDFKMNNLSELETDVPNGEYITDFRYAVGALICQKIIDKEGMIGIFEALQAGRSEENYFEVIEKKLGVKKNDFEKYVKSEFMKLKPMNDLELQKFKY